MDLGPVTLKLGPVTDTLLMALDLRPKTLRRGPRTFIMNACRSSYEVSVIVQLKPKWEFVDKFYQHFMNIRSAGLESKCADGRTDRAKITGAFLQLLVAHEPKKRKVLT